jgi:hypothetical protein
MNRFAIGLLASGVAAALFVYAATHLPKIALLWFLL